MTVTTYEITLQLIVDVPKGLFTAQERAQMRRSWRRWESKHSQLRSEMAAWRRTR
jgi:hypothetical protein